MHTKNYQSQTPTEYGPKHMHTQQIDCLPVCQPAEHLKQHLQKALEKSILVLFLCLSHQALIGQQ